MEKASSNKKLTGIVIPLGAIRTRTNSVIGDYLSLKKVVDFCKKSDLSIIQLLPVNDSGMHSSPYSGLSAFALHPIYVSIENVPNFPTLYKEDEQFAKKYGTFIKKYSNPISKSANRFDYSGILEAKVDMLFDLFQNAYEDPKTGTHIFDFNLSKWIEKNVSWIRGYAVFKALKDKNHQSSWKSWKAESKSMSPEKIDEEWSTEEPKKQQKQVFYTWIQYICHKQFKESTDYARENGILLKGDMPILMNEDSCDAWEHYEVFNHTLRAGSPPDGDNPNGQNWGFPTYNWTYLKKTGYKWWKDRLISASQYYDAYRLDHLLGFFRIWAVPEADSSAALGHTEPYEAITRIELKSLGFDDGRTKWLSVPHIPTSKIQDLTHDLEMAHKILEIFCTQIGTEELWNFKSTLKGDHEILEADFTSILRGNLILESQIKETLSKCWSDRTLIEVEPDNFVPVWKYGESTSWNSLNPQEKQKLKQLFDEKNEIQTKLWKNHASNILKNLTESVKMIPCGEDLGVNLECVPTVMKNYKILSLKVLRWCRLWEIKDQPFTPFTKYPELSVTTTSVHDSSTLRQWWEDEKSAVKEFLTFVKEKKITENDEFSPKIAELILKNVAKAKSKWTIHPLQDFLYLDEKYYLKNAKDERVNVPGSVNQFNWTYMLPATIEEISENDELCKKISEIAKIHQPKTVI